MTSESHTTVRESADKPAPQVQVLSQAELISQSLKDVSRQMRRPIATWTSVLRYPLAQVKNSFGAALVAAFIVVVVIPVLVSGLYLAIFASDQYASETRFAVRGGEQQTGDAAAGISSALAALRNQDSMIVADYIEGRGMVEELEKNLNMREMFARGDPVFGFSPNKPIEKLVRYWDRQVDVDRDRLSGIITVVVRAFSPQDALAITRGVAAASEKLVNEMSERARQDALKQARFELSLAEKVLQDRLKAMQDLRNREGILDVDKTTDALTKLIGDLRLELARMESEYSSQKESVSVTSPQMRVLEARIRSARDQIRLIEARMTAQKKPRSDGSASSEDVLAESVSRFDRLRLEQEFAQRQYVASASALERARVEVQTQQVYLTTFLQPVLAEDALYPKRGWILLAISAICLVLWGIGTGVAVMVRNYAL